MTYKSRQFMYAMYKYTGVVEILKKCVVLVVRENITNVFNLKCSFRS